MLSMLKTGLPAGCILILMLFCSQQPSGPLETYTPSIYFAGYVNNDYDSLPGNRWYPNVCSLKGDTIRIFMYSQDYKIENRIWTGDFMRIDIYPNTSDSLIETGDILFHFARYHQINATYNVLPEDSLDPYRTIQIRISNLQRRHGGRIDLDGIYVRTQPVVGGDLMIIKNGHIEGTIQ